MLGLLSKSKPFEFSQLNPWVFFFRFFFIKYMYLNYQYSKIKLIWSLIFIQLFFLGASSTIEKKQTENIFTSNAAAGILTNDLVRIMEAEEVIIMLMFIKVLKIISSKLIEHDECNKSYRIVQKLCIKQITWLLKNTYTVKPV